MSKTRPQSPAEDLFDGSPRFLFGYTEQIGPKPDKAELVRKNIDHPANGRPYRLF